jgi:hypothetical protein
MPSLASTNSADALERADILTTTALMVPAVRRSVKAQIYYHAALAICVAAWDAYLKGVVTEFYVAVNDPLNPQFHSMTTISKAFADRLKERFNTPNFENARDLIVNCTGYDPYADWVWPRRSMSVLQVQERLNQILRVRHSFAHGFPIPTYPWTQSGGGKVRLTKGAVRDAQALLRHLIVRTDRGLASHIGRAYGISVGWH